MTTIFERVETALNTLAPVPNAMGRMIMASGDLPDTYLAYSVIDSSPDQHFDDQEASRDHLVQVTIYSRAGLVNIPNVDGAMTAAGFTKGNFRQLPRDAQSGHYGLAKDYHYYEEEIDNV
jgi:hypothetical protein